MAGHDIGLLFERSNVNVQAIAALMAFDIRRVIIHLKHAIKDKKDIEKDIKEKHDLLLSNEEVDKLVKELKKGDIYSNKIMIRQLLMIRKWLIILKRLIKEGKIEEEKIEKDIDKIIADKDKKTAEEFQAIKEEDSKEMRLLRENIKKHLEEVAENLETLRKYANGLEKEAENKEGMEKIMSSVPGYLQRITTRWAVKKEGKEIKITDTLGYGIIDIKEEEKKLIENIKKRKENIKKQNDKLKGLEKKIQDEEKKDKTLEKEIISFITHMHTVLFMDVIIMKSFLKIAKESDELSKEFIKNRLVPQKYGEEIIDKIKEVMGYYEKSLDGIETGIKEIWALTQEDIKLAA